MAERIARALQLDPSERAEFLGNFQTQTRRVLPEESKTEVLRLTSDQFEVISDWIHFAILNLVKTADAQPEAAWMAERLGLSVTKVRAALERLERLKLIQKDPTGKWVRTYARINTPDDVLNVSVQKSHLADMELARTALLREPIERRDFTSMTIAVHPDLLPRAKEIIRRAQDEIAELSAESPATEVYRLTSSLFPLTLSKLSQSKLPQSKMLRSPS